MNSAVSSILVAQNGNIRQDRNPASFTENQNRDTAESHAGKLAPPIICPMCGLENASDTIFCANDRCHKALGEFRFVQEELKTDAHWHSRLAERVTAFVGKPRFVLTHLAWFALWIAVNSGLIAVVRRFDTYPFSLLGFLLTAEAIFLSGFILVSEMRQTAHADKRAELDYEVSVRTYREVQKLEIALHATLERLNHLEDALRQAQSASSTASEEPKP